MTRPAVLILWWAGKQRGSSTDWVPRAHTPPHPQLRRQLRDGRRRVGGGAQPYREVGHWALENGTAAAWPSLSPTYGHGGFHLPLKFERPSPMTKSIIIATSVFVSFPYLLSALTISQTLQPITQTGRRNGHWPRRTGRSTYVSPCPPHMLWDAIGSTFALAHTNPPPEITFIPPHNLCFVRTAHLSCRPPSVPSCLCCCMPHYYQLISISTQLCPISGVFRFRDVSVSL
jgi:hypothetical protein